MVATTLSVCSGAQPGNVVSPGQGEQARDDSQPQERGLEPTVEGQRQQDPKPQDDADHRGETSEAGRHDQRQFGLALPTGAAVAADDEAMAAAAADQRAGRVFETAVLAADHEGTLAPAP